MHRAPKPKRACYCGPPKVEVGYDPARVRGEAKAPVTIVEFSDLMPLLQEGRSHPERLAREIQGASQARVPGLPPTCVAPTGTARGGIGRSRITLKQLRNCSMLPQTKKRDTHVKRHLHLIEISVMLEPSGTSRDTPPIEAKRRVTKAA